MKQNNQITVFISCPGELEKERKIVQSVCKSLSKVFERSRNLSVRSIFWKDDILFEITGDEAQKQINDYLTDIDYDIYIGILWKEFGKEQQNGFTPTEEEFEDALNKHKATKRPRIKFLFKENNKKKNPSYFSRVSNFQYRVYKEGLADSFLLTQDFQEKVNEFILTIVENLDYLPKLKKREKSNIIFEKEYLERKIVDSSTYNSTSFQYFGDEKLKELYSIIKAKQRIILLGDAGIGKSKELEYAEYQFSQENSPLFPILIKLNKYGPNELTSLFSDDWKEIPQNQLLLLMDGFDEVESKYRNDLIKQIELFSDKRPECRMVIASRTNFYNSENEKEAKIGTLKDFETFVLTKLSYEQYQTYVEEHLNKNSDIFWETISLNKMHDLLGIPFYLLYLVQKFNSEQNIPNSRTEIFADIIKSRIVFDENHYRLKLGEEQVPDRNIILKRLERLALAMEMLGRNHLSDAEYFKIEPNIETRELLKHKVLFNKRNFNWEFELQSFQEYLAAKFLSKKNFKDTKPLFTFKPNYQKVIPSWTNTLSFLLNMNEDESIKKWILNNEPELTIKFEQDRFPEKTRISIFKKIFNNYKQKKIWIDYQKYNFLELAKFGQSETSINFLLNQIKEENHYIILGNSINLLRNMNIPSTLKLKVENKLLKIACTYNKPSIQNDAIIAISLLKLDSKIIVDKIIKKLGNSENDWIRYGLYILLNDSKYLNENVELFLNGIKYIRIGHFSMIQDESRLGNEAWELAKGLSKITEVPAIKKVIKHFTKNPRELEDYSIERVATKIWSNTATVFSEDNSIFDLVLELFIALKKDYLQNQYKSLRSFFKQTDTSKKAFDKIYEVRKNHKDEYLHLLASLIDKEGFEFVLEKYKKGQFSDDEMWSIFNIMSYENIDNRKEFIKYINKQTNNKFSPKPIRDFDKERADRYNRELELLFNKEVFLKEVQYIYNEESKKSFTKNDLEEIQKKYLRIVISVLKDLCHEKRITLSQVRIMITSQKWENWSINKIYNHLVNDKKFEASEFHITQIKKWCKKNVNKVDFNSALIQEGTTYRTSWNAVYLSYFLGKFKFKYPHKVLLDMLSFDWHNNGIFYLLDFLSVEDIKTRIRYNLKLKKLNNYELRNYLNFAKEYKIDEIKEVSVNLIKNKNMDSELRRLGLEVLNSIDVAEKTLIKVIDDFKWEVVSWLFEHKSRGLEYYLLNLLKNGTFKNKLKSSLVLIRFENIEGLKYYTAHVEKSKEYYPEKDSPIGVRSNPITEIQSIQALPYIIRLLRLTFLEKVKDDKFNTLYQAALNVLTKIALADENNFVCVQKEVEKFIKINQFKFKDVNFLHSFIESLENKYYLNKSEEPSIDYVVDVLSKLETTSN